jgi:hypothetical protein
VLDRVLARGKLNCLVTPDRLFWSTRAPGEANLHRGLAADMCLAIAAFIFATPNPANRTNFVESRVVKGVTYNPFVGLGR